jgi:hypothetical protein
LIKICTIGGNLKLTQEFPDAIFLAEERFEKAKKFG